MISNYIVVIISCFCIELCVAQNEINFRLYTEHGILEPLNIVANKEFKLLEGQRTCFKLFYNKTEDFVVDDIRVFEANTNVTIKSTPINTNKGNLYSIEIEYPYNVSRLWTCTIYMKNNVHNQIGCPTFKVHIRPAYANLPRFFIDNDMIPIQGTELSINDYDGFGCLVFDEKTKIQLQCKPFYNYFIETIWNTNWKVLSDLYKRFHIHAESVLSQKHDRLHVTCVVKYSEDETVLRLFLISSTNEYLKTTSYFNQEKFSLSLTQEQCKNYLYYPETADRESENPKSSYDNNYQNSTTTVSPNTSYDSEDTLPEQANAQNGYPTITVLKTSHSNNADLSSIYKLGYENLIPTKRTNIPFQNIDGYGCLLSNDAELDVSCQTSTMDTVINLDASTEIVSINESCNRASCSILWLFTDKDDLLYIDCKVGNEIENQRTVRLYIIHNKSDFLVNIPFAYDIDMNTLNLNQNECVSYVKWYNSHVPLNRKSKKIGKKNKTTHISNSKIIKNNQNKSNNSKKKKNNSNNNYPTITTKKPVKATTATDINNKSERAELAKNETPTITSGGNNDILIWSVATIFLIIILIIAILCISKAQKYWKLNMTQENRNVSCNHEIYESGQPLQHPRDNIYMDPGANTVQYCNNITDLYATPLSKLERKKLVSNTEKQNVGLHDNSLNREETYAEPKYAAIRNGNTNNSNSDFSEDKDYSYVYASCVRALPKIEANTNDANYDYAIVDKKRNIDYNNTDRNNAGYSNVTNKGNKIIPPDNYANNIYNGQEVNNINKNYVNSSDMLYANSAELKK